MITQPLKKIILPILVICLLSACATKPATTGPLNQKLSWQQRSEQLSSITQWHVTGAIAINTPKQNIQASINWQQDQKDTYAIDLFGPLGLGAIKLVSTSVNQGYNNTNTPNGTKADKPPSTLNNSTLKVTLTDSKGKKHTANTAEKLMQNELGWSLPVSNLYYWVRGLPAPGISEHATYDSYNHITQLQQQGWTIKYLRYTAFDNTDVPSKIFLSRPDLNIRIVISQWE